jgi:hypothetical protein
MRLPPAIQYAEVIDQQMDRQRNLEMDPNSAQYLPGLAYVNKLNAAQPSGSVFYDPDPDYEPGWATRQAGRLLAALSSGLNRLGTRLRQEKNWSVDVPLPATESSTVRSQ